jgi:hypothetical protein
VFAGTIPFGPFAGETVNVSLLQMVVDMSDIAGLGFTASEKFAPGKKEKENGR